MGNLFEKKVGLRGETTSPLVLRNYMGEMPAHFPETKVTLSYDDEAVYLAIHVADRYVRAVASGYQDNVSRDSCVEFFFTPGEAVSAGYFNLEINCGGTMLFHFQKEFRQEMVAIPEEDGRRIECTHSMPKMVDPEITEPAEWTVECRIPIDVLEKYGPVVRPSPGAVWRANFYKCADRTSHPHWLTWAPVDLPKPDFHQPRFFGTLKFG